MDPPPVYEPINPLDSEPLPTAVAFPPNVRPVSSLPHLPLIQLQQLQLQQMQHLQSQHHLQQPHPAQQQACFVCLQPGHKAVNCPQSVHRLQEQLLRHRAALKNRSKVSNVVLQFDWTLHTLTQSVCLFVCLFVLWLWLLRQGEKKPIVCYRCGEVGHYSDKCQSTQKTIKSPPTSATSAPFSSSSGTTVITGAAVPLSSSNNGSSAPNGGPNALKKSIICFKCHAEGHYADQCPKSSSHNKSTVQCFKCGEEGHYADQCPSPVRCFKCSAVGHYADQCPYPVVCFKCGFPGHYADSCPHHLSPRQPGALLPNPKRYITCFKCGLAGHYADKCTVTVPYVPARPVSQDNVLMVIAGAATPVTTPATSPVTGPGPVMSPTAVPLVCGRCHTEGHSADMCPNARCLKCGFIGHDSASCELATILAELALEDYPADGSAESEDGTAQAEFDAKVRTLIALLYLPSIFFTLLFFQSSDVHIACAFSSFLFFPCQVLHEQNENENQVHAYNYPQPQPPQMRKVIEPLGPPTVPRIPSNPIESPTLPRIGSNPLDAPTLPRVRSNPLDAPTLPRVGSNPMDAPPPTVPRISSNPVDALPPTVPRVASNPMDKNLCVKCNQQTSDHIVLMCMHMCLCSDCGPKYNDVQHGCPVCHAEITCIKRVYTA